MLEKVIPEIKKSLSGVFQAFTSAVITPELPTLSLLQNLLLLFIFTEFVIS